MQLVASGTGADLARFQSVANATEGSGVIEITLDTIIEVPFAPDIRLHQAIGSGLAGLTATIRAIPGVHLDREITWTDDGGQGVLRIEARNNPVPIILGAIVAALLPWIAALAFVGLAILVGWKIWQKLPGIAKAGTGAVFLLILAAVALVVFSKGKALAAGVG